MVSGPGGADPKVSGTFYKAVAQAVLLFGADMCVLTQSTEKALDSFQSRVARRLTDIQPRLKKYRNWEYLPLAKALRETVMEEIRKSITRRQNTVLQYIATRPILDLCKRATRQPGAQVSRWWSEQAGIDLKGARKRSAES